MLRRIVAFWLILLIAIGSLVALDTTVDFIRSAGGETLYVNETGGNGTYTGIQEAIDDAVSGDVVFVYSGCYGGNIIVNKTIDLIGEDENTTIIEGTGSGVVVDITAHWVNMSHFTIAGVGTGPDDKALELNDADNCTITNVKISIGLTVEQTIDITNITVSDIISFTLQAGSVPVYYNTSADDSFNQTFTCLGSNYVHCIYDTNDTFSIRVSEIYNPPPFTIIYPNSSNINITPVDMLWVVYPNSSYFNITPVDLYLVNYTIISPFKINASPVYTINYINTSLNSSNFIYDVPAVNWTYYTDIEPIYWIPVSSRVNLTAAAGDGTVFLHWTSQSSYNGLAITGYRIYRAQANGHEVLVAEVGNSTDYYMDDDVRNGVTYRYRVRINTEMGGGPPSNEVSVQPHHESGFYDSLTTRYAGLIWWLWLIIAIAATMLYIGAVNCCMDVKSRKD